jgi:hypothetical protein
MSAQRRRPARRDGTHHAPLDAAEMTGMHLPKSVAVVAKHIRHLQSGTHGARSAEQGGRLCDPVPLGGRDARHHRG